MVLVETTCVLEKGEIERVLGPWEAIEQEVFGCDTVFLFQVGKERIHRMRTEKCWSHGV